MPAVTRVGDVCSGHGCWPSRPSVEGSPNVFINGLPVVRQGDAFAPHTCPDIPETHGGVLAGGSPTVFVNGRPVGRIGDAVSCGGAVAAGSPNVFIDEKRQVDADGSTPGHNADGSPGGFVDQEPPLTEFPEPLDPDPCSIEIVEKIMAHKGWNVSAHFQRYWKEAPSAVRPEASAPPRYVRMDWVLTNPTAREAFEDWVQDPLDSGHILSPEAREIMAKMMAKRIAEKLRGNDFSTDQTWYFDKTSLPPEERHAWHINFKAVEAAGYIGANDDVSGALGNFAFYAHPRATVIPIGGNRWEVIVLDVGIDIFDVFEFNGEQKLGWWNPETNKGPREVGGCEMTNDKHNIWRSQHGRGGDFPVYSDIKIYELSSPVRFKVTSS
ncbi:MAG: PAAR repeat-containing protein [Rhodospirillaceae bacterium]|nr:MAG: PAAR repeat-containing protein [Rhodospirillaceae bacterium]